MNDIICSTIEHMNKKEKYFNVLRKIGNNADLTQRDLAKETGYSLGKLNYCLKELQSKGFVKIKHFKRNLRERKKIKVEGKKENISSRADGGPLY